MTAKNKFFYVLLAVCLLLFASAVSEDEAFTVRGAVTFGMSQEEVTAAETVRNYEIDNEKRGNVDFLELEYEDITENGVRADLKYLFADKALVAVQLNYDTDDVSYTSVRDGLVKAYGQPAALDLKALGNGIYVLDDDGRPEGQMESWVTGKVMIVLELDEDDVNVTYLDLDAEYIRIAE